MAQPNFTPLFHSTAFPQIATRPIILGQTLNSQMRIILAIQLQFSNLPSSLRKFPGRRIFRFSEFRQRNFTNTVRPFHERRSLGIFDELNPAVPSTLRKHCWLWLCRQKCSQFSHSQNSTPTTFTLTKPITNYNQKTVEGYCWTFSMCWIQLLASCVDRTFVSGPISKNVPNSASQKMPPQQTSPPCCRCPFMTRSGRDQWHRASPCIVSEFHQYRVSVFPKPQYFV